MPSLLLTLDPLRAAHPALTVAPVPFNALRVTIPAGDWLALAIQLKSDSALQMDRLRCITGTDYADRHTLTVTYMLESFTLRHDCTVKIDLPRDHPTVPSVAHIWRAADWHERETYDLLGIVFANHPDSVRDSTGIHPRRILLPDDWVGFPLRRDYPMPEMYHDLPGSVELKWEQKPEYPK